MTAMPPPPAVPMPNYGQPPVARPTNVWAIISLVCGIIGCMVITGIAGIITGIVGLSQSKQKGGRGLAITGIILSVLSLVAVAAMAGFTVWGVKYAVKKVKEPAIAAINACVDGDVARATAAAGLSEDAASALAEKVKGFGHCTDISFNNVSSSATPGGKTFSGSGSAVFEKAGAKDFAIVVEQRGDKLVVTDIEVR